LCSHRRRQLNVANCYVHGTRRQRRMVSLEEQFAVANIPLCRLQKSTLPFIRVWRTSPRSCQHMLLWGADRVPVTYRSRAADAVCRMWEAHGCRARSAQQQGPKQ
jgi:hypothetical protein